MSPTTTTPHPSRPEERTAICITWGRGAGRVRFDDGTEADVQIARSAFRGRVRSPEVGETVRVMSRYGGKLAVWPLDAPALVTELQWRSPTAPTPPARLGPMLDAAVRAALQAGESPFRVASRWGLPVARVRAGSEDPAPLVHFAARAYDRLDE
jgi:hypothetical protein